jgi:N-methylhydantoinase A/oxoprolinase/acetone carboxylase beta subunit
LLAAPIEHEFSSAFHTELASASLASVRETLGTLDHDVQALMRQENVEGLTYERQYSADIGYVGQSHFIEVPLDPKSEDLLDRLYLDFEVAHERVNGLKTGAPAKIVNLRAVHRAHLPPVTLGEKPGGKPGSSRKGTRNVLFPAATEPQMTAIHDRALLTADETLDGPIVIEQDDTTTLLPTGWHARVVAGAALLITRKDEA